MKILIIGATGNTGQRLLSLATEKGHTVTAFVRSEKKLREQHSENMIAHIRVLEGSALDGVRVAEAAQGQDVVINTAGNVVEGESFTTLVETVARAVESALGDGGRFWLFGGAGVLDVPGTNIMSVEYPKVPAIFRAHETNYRLVMSTKLNWSMMCPGPMTDGDVHEGLRVSAEEWPVPRPAIFNYLPKIMTSILFKSKMPELTITYDDAVSVLLDNLSSDSRYSNKRVGVALPVGLRGSKDISNLSDQEILPR